MCEAEIWWRPRVKGEKIMEEEGRTYVVILAGSAADFSSKSPWI